MLTTTSSDGTTIAYDQVGQGPTLILITGALNYTKFGVVKDLIPFLSNDYTVINYDRRGRGASGNNLPYSVDKEIEDIWALIDTTGSPAYLYGHSAGAALALFAAAELGEHVKVIASYEPPLSRNWKTDQPAKLAILNYKRMAATGQYLEMIIQFMRFVGMSEELIIESLTSEHSDVLVGMAPTLVFEAEIMLQCRPFLKQLAKRVTQPVLLLSGDKSYDSVPYDQEVYAKALPHAQTKVLQGQTHTVDADVLAPVLKSFFI